jgi:glycosyltransferase
MKISLITAVLNNKDTIIDAIESVSRQTYKGIEHIIVDGGSTDGTLDTIKRYNGSIARIISEPDGGIYDALNKGIGFASGDVVGALHADDFYSNDNVIKMIAEVFEKKNVDSCYGDLEYVNKRNTDRVLRHWKSSEYVPGKFRFGWMPPHPTFFVRKGIYEKYGYFNTKFQVAADYELMLRLFEKHKISTHYIPEVLVKMRFGGMSNNSLRNILIKSSEDYKAWKVNNLNGGLCPVCFTIFLKNVSKIPQFLNI